MARRATLATGAVALLGLVTACAGSPPPAPSAPGAPVAVRTVIPARDGPRPILVDTDLDADDLVALAILLGDPEVDIRAVTVSGTGIVHCLPGVDVARRWLAAFGRRDVRVACGRETPGPGGRAFPDEWRASADAGFGLDLPQARPVGASGTGEAEIGDRAATLIGASAAAAEGHLVIVALGPWTNLADAIREDPSVGGRIAEIHAMLGVLDAPGNVDVGSTDPDAHVEWNAGADPDAVAAVLRSDVPVTLVPLDATNAISPTPELAHELGGVGAGTGADLISQLYLRNPAITSSGQSLWDSLTAVLLSQPELATWSELRVAVTTDGDSAGRLSRAADGRPIRAALEADGPRAIRAWFAALTRSTVPIGPDGKLLP